MTPLAPLKSIIRPLSVSEYYHACIGASRFTLERPREVVLILSGTGSCRPDEWQKAIDRMAEVNPGTRLRMVGTRRRARWDSGGAPPRLRVLEHCAWDGQSERGADFIHATKLCLRAGPSVELILAASPYGEMRVILRSLHAMIDGRGALHVLAELFRALRGEALLGTNGAFSDFDFRRSVGKVPMPPRALRASWLLGPLSGAGGDVFRRISLNHPPSDLLARVALAIAAFARGQGDNAVRIGLPVDLRPHVPGLLTTMNFCDMIFLPVAADEQPADFKRRVRERVQRAARLGYPDAPDIMKCLPLPWLDLLVSRTPWNLRSRKPRQTACISNFGKVDAMAVTAPGFLPRDIATLPAVGDIFLTMAGLGERVDIMVGAPALADEHLLDALLAHLREALEVRPHQPPER